MGVKLVSKKSKSSGAQPPASGVIAGHAHSGSKRNIRSVSIFILVGVAMVAAAGFTLFVQVRPRGGSQICSSNKKLIDSYNNTVRTKGITKLGELTTNIRKGNYQNDPTCIYMLMIAEYGDMSSNRELELYTQLRTLEAKGIHVSSRINDGIDRQQVEDFLKQRQEEKKENRYGDG